MNSVLSVSEPRYVEARDNGDFVFSEKILRVPLPSVARSLFFYAPVLDMPLAVASLIAEFAASPDVKAYLRARGWARSGTTVYGSSKRTRSGRRRSPGLTINLEDKSISDADAIQIGAIIECESTRVISVDLGSNQIGDSGVTAITRALSVNSKAEILDVQSNDLGADGLASVAKLLKTNRRLAVLHVGLNPKVGDEGVTAMADALQTNRSLTGFVGLNTVGCTSVGAQKLAEALTSNSALRALGLDDNPIGDEGVAALAESLKSNRTLEFLGLNNVGMSVEGVIALAEALKVNRTLTRLNVRSNQGLTEEILAAFDDEEITCEVTGDIDSADASEGQNVISVGSNIGVMFSSSAGNLENL